MGNYWWRLLGIGQMPSVVRPGLAKAPQVEKPKVATTRKEHLQSELLRAQSLYHMAPELIVMVEDVRKFMGWSVGEACSQLTSMDLARFVRFTLGQDGHDVSIQERLYIHGRIRAVLEEELLAESAEADREFLEKTLAEPPQEETTEHYRAYLRIVDALRDIRRRLDWVATDDRATLAVLEDLWAKLPPNERLMAEAQGWRSWPDKYDAYMSLEPKAGDKIQWGDVTYVLEQKRHGVWDARREDEALVSMALSDECVRDLLAAVPAPTVSWEELAKLGDTGEAKAQEVAGTVNPEEPLLKKSLQGFTDEPNGTRDGDESPYRPGQIWVSTTTGRRYAYVCTDNKGRQVVQSLETERFHDLSRIAKLVTDDHWVSRLRGRTVHKATVDEAGFVGPVAQKEGTANEEERWRPVSEDTAYAPPFGAIRACRGCGCLVFGGPTACARCANVDKIVSDLTAAQVMASHNRIFPTWLVRGRTHISPTQGEETWVFGVYSTQEEAKEAAGILNETLMHVSADRRNRTSAQWKEAMGGWALNIDQYATERIRWDTANYGRVYCVEETKSRGSLGDGLASINDEVV